MKAPFDKFNPNTTRWVPANALALAHAARLAYANKGDVADQIEAWGFPRSGFVFFESPNSDQLLDTQAFLTANDETVVLSFRGTQPDTVQDWLTDLNAVFRQFKVGLVHKGFYDALNAIWPDVLAALIPARAAGQSLWITGHSLGAALACLATARLVFEERQPVSGLHTFGQPRTGNPEYARAFDQAMGDKTYRFVNDQDIVTRVPPRELLYQHVGRLMFFDGKGRLQNDDHFWNRFLMTVEVDFESVIKPGETIGDHSIDRYIANLKKNLKRKLTW